MIIDRFLKVGREFLGSKYPIMCGAMTWISDPNLVNAVGQGGGFGLLAGGNTPVDVFRAQIIETREKSKAPFGVNIITLAPVYRDHLDLVCDLGCEFVVFAGGIAKKSEIAQVRESGAKVICFASTAPLAHMLVEPSKEVGRPLVVWVPLQKQRESCSLLSCPELLGHQHHHLAT